MKKFVIISLITTFAFASNECVMTMGYKLKNKEPYIIKDSSGLYKELYEKALNNIGCKLKIQRASKKRILNKLKKGEIDFYPGFNFSEKRSKFVHYLKNGLPKGFTAITRTEIKDLSNLKQIEELKLKNIVEKAGANLLTDLKIKEITISELNLSKAVLLIQKKRADIYIYNKAQIDYYIKKYKPENIKTHPNLYKSQEALYLGFSKKSKYIKELKNKDFNENKKISLNNYPKILDENSIAYKFKQALLSLKKSTYTDELYNKYFK